MITRLIFCAPYRIPVATVSLKFDHNLLGVSRNIIVSPVNTRDLFRYLSQYGIDTNRFEHLPDQELIEQYPEIENWVFENDYRNNWLKQQAIKLAALDYVDYQVALIHDPDTWMIQPYQPVNAQGQLCMLALKDVTEGSYDPVLPSVLGKQRQTTHCFVTEFMPVHKQDWTTLKQTLEQLHQKHFLNAIIDNVPETETIDGLQHIKWFSEYEFLGNWTMSQRSVNFMFQKRFGIESVEDLNALNITEYNSICDQSSGASPALGFDCWNTGNIPNYQRCMNLLAQHFLDLKST
jgi:hypothetical protein